MGGRVRRNRAGRETRDRIVSAIRELLADIGLDGLTIKAICDRAGVKSGSFYNLFPSKEQAILTVVGEAIAAVDPHPDAPEQDSLQELIDAHGASRLDEAGFDAFVGAPGEAALFFTVLRPHRAADEGRPPACE